MYDLTGDIHGFAEPLKTLLTKLGYHEGKKSWQHPERKAFFAGDYIDRGPVIPEALKIVISMADAGNAIALIGNHEYSALAYHYAAGHGNYLREHSPKNYDQHKHTIEQFNRKEKLWEQYLTCFQNPSLIF